MKELFGRFWGWGGDEAPAGEDPPDGGYGRGRPVAVPQVVGDGVGPGVQALVGQGLAELHDLVLEGLRGSVGAGPGPAGARFQPGFALGVESLDELMDPLPGHPVVPGHLRLGPSLGPDRRHHQPSQ